MSKLKKLVFSSLLWFLTIFCVDVSHTFAADVWHPAVNTSFQWQLTGNVDQSVDAQVYDIDLFDTDKSVVDSLHAKGRKVICYMSAGTFEDWRPDASQFPANVKGSSNGWPGEKWLDIRNTTALAPIIGARLDLCKQKGFDGVEFDNVDGYSNKTGFPLTANDQLTYNKWLADQAHAKSLSVGLKNDVDQVPQLINYFDWALNEQCFQYNECENYSLFVNAGKPVFEVEYSLATSKFCPQANAMNFNAYKMDLDLTGKREACRTGFAATTIPTSPTKSATPTVTKIPTITTIPTKRPTTSPSLAPIATPTIFPTPTTGTALSLTVFLHGIGQAGDSINPHAKENFSPATQTRPITISLINNKGKTITKNGTVTFDKTTGSYKTTIELGGVASGNYTAKIKIAGFLPIQISEPISISSNKTTIAPAVSLVTGDLNDDNILDGLDYNILISCYGTKFNTSACLDKKADLNDDGVVDGIDYNLFIRELSSQNQ